MIERYCQDVHRQRIKLCSQCEELRTYALKRLEKCPYQEGKTTCVQCPTHCYRKDMRERIREAMRYAGPRMLFRHPILTLFHVFDGRRKTPVRRSQ